LLSLSARRKNIIAIPLMLSLLSKMLVQRVSPATHLTRVHEIGNEMEGIAKSVEQIMLQLNHSIFLHHLVDTTQGVASVDVVMKTDTWNINQHMNLLSVPSLLSVPVASHESRRITRMKAISAIGHPQQSSPPHTTVLLLIVNTTW